MMNLLRTFPLLMILLCSAGIAHAGIEIAKTRVIYPADEGEVTLSMENHARQPRLVQAWIDNGDPSVQPQDAKTPFIATPPLFRVNPDKGQSVRIVFTGGPVRQDRESVFWLNLLEVQPKVRRKENSNYMLFPIRTRLKIFYRPDHLPGSPADAFKTLRWHLVSTPSGLGMECTNPSAWNVSFMHLMMKAPKTNNEIVPSGMCPAKEKKTFFFHGPRVAERGKIAFATISDGGTLSEREVNYGP